MKHVAPLRYDVIFKKAFSHPEIFTAFAKDFLDIGLQIDDHLLEKRINAEKSEIAKNMLKDGIRIEKVALYTGLTVKQIKELQI